MTRAVDNARRKDPDHWRDECLQGAGETYRENVRVSDECFQTSCLCRLEVGVFLVFCAVRPRKHPPCRCLYILSMAAVLCNMLAISSPLHEANLDPFPPAIK